MKKHIFLAFLIMGLCSEAAVATQPMSGSMDTETSVASIKFLGATGIPTGTQFKGTEIGGLSGATYDSKTDTYYVISDDRSGVNPARFYTLKINLADGDFDRSDIVFKDVVTLRDANGKTYVEDSLDPESIAITPSRTLLISSEGNTENLVAPFVNEYSMNGYYLGSFPIDKKFLPVKGGKSGVLDNRAFESLTISPDNQTVYVAVEDTLAQDGMSSGINQQGIARFIQYDLASRNVMKEFLYKIESIDDKPGLAKLNPENSVADILAIDNHGTFLVLERYYDDGGLNTNKLYEIKTDGLKDVKELMSIKGEQKLTFASKRLLFDFKDTGVNLDDFEGLVFGPPLPDGSQSLIVVSDNDFEAKMAETQIFLFSIIMKN